MRKFLLFIGWSSYIGSFFDAALGLYALWLVLTVVDVPLLIDLDTYIRDYVSIIYWVKQLAYYVMSTGVVTWLFAVPAVIYFPIRILMSLVIGYWALNKAEQLR